MRVMRSHKKYLAFFLLFGFASASPAKIHDDGKYRGEEHYRKGASGQAGAVKGVAGVDYPDYKTIPVTSFRCSDQSYSGLYADIEAQCQVYHSCHNGRKNSFMCVTGTVFNQQTSTCDYWYSVECDRSESFYYLNGFIGISDHTKGGYAQRPGLTVGSPVRVPGGSEKRPLGPPIAARPPGPDASRKPFPPPFPPRGGFPVKPPNIFNVPKPEVVSPPIIQQTVAEVPVPPPITKKPNVPIIPVPIPPPGPELIPPVLKEPLLPITVQRPETLPPLDDYDYPEPVPERPQVVLDNRPIPGPGYDAIIVNEPGPIVHDVPKIPDIRPVEPTHIKKPIPPIPFFETQRPGIIKDFESKKPKPFVSSEFPQPLRPPFPPKFPKPEIAIKPTHRPFLTRSPPFLPKPNPPEVIEQRPLELPPPTITPHFVSKHPKPDYIPGVIEQRPVEPAFNEPPPPAITPHFVSKHPKPDYIPGVIEQRPVEPAFNEPPPPIITPHFVSKHPKPDYIPGVIEQRPVEPAFNEPPPPAITPHFVSKHPKPDYIEQRPVEPAFNEPPPRPKPEFIPELIEQKPLRPIIVEVQQPEPIPKGPVVIPAQKPVLEEGFHNQKSGFGYTQKSGGKTTGSGGFFQGGSFGTDASKTGFDYNQSNTGSRKTGFFEGSKTDSTYGRDHTGSGYGVVRGGPHNTKTSFHQESGLAQGGGGGTTGFGQTNVGKTSVSSFTQSGDEHSKKGSKIGFAQGGGGGSSKTGYGYENTNTNTGYIDGPFVQQQPEVIVQEFETQANFPSDFEKGQGFAQVNKGVSGTKSGFGFISEDDGKAFLPHSDSPKSIHQVITDSEENEHHTEEPYHKITLTNVPKEIHDYVTEYLRTEAPPFVPESPKVIVRPEDKPKTVITQVKTTIYGQKPGSGVVSVQAGPAFVVQSTPEEDNKSQNGGGGGFVSGGKVFIQEKDGVPQITVENVNPGNNQNGYMRTVMKQSFQSSKQQQQQQQQSFSSFSSGPVDQEHKNACNLCKEQSNNNNKKESEFRQHFPIFGQQQQQQQGFNDFPQLNAFTNQQQPQFMFRSHQQQQQQQQQQFQSSQFQQFHFQGPVEDSSWFIAPPGGEIGDTTRRAMMGGPGD